MLDGKLFRCQNSLKWYTFILSFTDYNYFRKEVMEMSVINDSNEYKLYIKNAIIKLLNSEFEESYNLIVHALSINPNAPEPQNLLGIWYEFKGDEDMAMKHYRASSALDPTYKPANKNIERICTFYVLPDMTIDFGDEILLVKND